MLESCQQRAPFRRRTVPQEILVTPTSKRNRPQPQQRLLAIAERAVSFIHAARPRGWPRRAGNCGTQLLHVNDLKHGPTSRKMLAFLAEKILTRRFRVSYAR
jgi:hypothetical protein